MSTDIIITLSILLLSVVFFVSGKVRSDLVALCALILLMVFGILTPDQALSGFANSVVIMMIGLFVVGGAIFKTGLAKMISSRILQLAGDNELKLFVLVILATAFIGAFVSNTGTVALMLPIIVSLAANARMNASRFLMPMAYASSMGGMLTLIGTPPNLVIHNALVEAGYEGLKFFTFTPVGIICVVVGTLLLIPLSKWFLSKDDSSKKEKKAAVKTARDLEQEYSLSKNLYRALVTGASPLTGRQLQELQITGRYNVSILEIRRKPTSKNPFFKTVGQELAGPQTVAEADDIVYIFGDYPDVVRFVRENDLTLLDIHTQESSQAAAGGRMEFLDIGIAEVVLLPESSLINQTVMNTGFREKYGVNILGIQHHGEYILRDLKDYKIKGSDVILVQGSWENIARLSADQSDWVVLGQPLAEASKVSLTHKAPVAGAILLGMVVCMMFDFIPVQPVTAVMIAAVMMVLTGCFRNVEDAYKTINWESIVLIAAMLPMSIALEITGVSTLISDKLVSGLGSYGPIFLLAGIYFTASLMTMFISNTATAVLIAPIALYSATQIGVSPYPFMFAVAVGTSMCFASPFSTPPNALVMSAGRYKFMDYVKVGLPLQLIMGIIMVLVLPLIFPF